MSSANDPGINVNPGHTVPASEFANRATEVHPTALQPEATPELTSSNEFFRLLNIPGNIAEQDSINIVIDVIADTRLLKRYIEYNISSLYPDLNVKGHAFVSPLSYAGYLLTTYYAMCLNFDVKDRPTMSYWATNYMNNQRRRDLLSFLNSCHVPKFFAEILHGLNASRDPNRQRMLFIPTLAAYNHKHDFGRCIPPLLYFKVHDLLATNDVRMNAAEYRNSIYELPIIEIERQAYCVANYFGTHTGYRYHNWCNRTFDAFFNPLTARAHLQRPTFSPIHIPNQSVPNHAYFNPYVFFLNASDSIIGEMKSVYSALSEFVRLHDPSSPTLAEIFNKRKGSAILIHSIEPLTVPTWNGKKLADPANNDYTAQTVCEVNNFLAKPVPAKTGHFEMPVVPADFPPYAIRMEDRSYDPLNDPIGFRSHYEADDMVQPDILIASPYDVSPSSFSIPLVLGFKIENAQIDGIAIPVENPLANLIDTNSMYLQAALPISKIQPIFHSETVTNTFYFVEERSRHHCRKQGFAIAIRNFMRNIFPLYPKTGASIDAFKQIDGFHLESNHRDPDYGYTYTAGYPNANKLSHNRIHVWSSYRVIPEAARPAEENTLMFCTLRGIYGTNLKCYKMAHPTYNMP
ncbi:coat protein [Steinernema ceratophorum partiti-like virus 1]|nr:coat protein [Steinernema ceratophorum partiti-like virus 1]